MAVKRQLIRRIVFCLIIVVLAFFVVKHYDATEYTAGDEQAFISKVCTMSGIPELSIAIWDGDEEVFLNNAGADEHSLYELASTTKAFTGLAVLQLEEQGLIDFDDPVSKYIPEFHPTYQGSEACVTVRHLLNHSSGIPFYMLERFAEEPYNKGGLAKSLSFLYDVKLSFEPGSVHEYSTVNYDLLALIIERVTGTGYEEYVKANNLSDIVHFLGRKTSAEISDLLHHAVCFLLFSNYENQPCVLLESFSTGTPVVTTPVGGILEITNDDNALIVPPKDEMQLIEKLNFILDHADQYQPAVIRKNALEICSPEVIGRKWLEIYRSL